MQQTTVAPPEFVPTPPQRRTIHDLRSLFGIVAAAKDMLERGSVDTRRTALGAIEDAVLRGGRLTSDLLSSAQHAAARSTDPGARLVDLAPMMNALADGRIELDLEVACPNSFVRIDAAAFDATILELVANSVAAKAGRIAVRSAKVGSRLWILVCDDGRGMPAARLKQARLGEDAGLIHGTGMSRVHAFVRSAHGDLFVRSGPGRGTSVALVLPAVLSLAAGVSRTPQRSAPPPPKQLEMTHEENRQPAAA